MNEEKLGFCGYDCGTCPAYIATQTNDYEMKEEVARIFSSFSPIKLTAEDINCYGCLSGTFSNTPLMEQCKICEVRVCAVEKEVNTTCLNCKDFTCSKLKEKWDQIPPDAKKNIKIIN